MSKKKPCAKESEGGKTGWRVCTYCERSDTDGGTGANHYGRGTHYSKVWRHLADLQRKGLAPRPRQEAINQGSNVQRQSVSSGRTTKIQMPGRGHSWYVEVTRFGDEDIQNGPALTLGIDENAVVFLDPSGRLRMERCPGGGVLINCLLEPKNLDTTSARMACPEIGPRSEDDQLVSISL